MLNHLKTVDRKICLVSIDFAGLSSRPHIMENLLVEFGAPEIESKPEPLPAYTLLRKITNKTFSNPISLLAKNQVKVYNFDLDFGQ
jgi:hypothetical protein